MLPFKVKYNPDISKWYVVGEYGVIGTYKRKKKAKNEAYGEAQTVADRQNISVTVEVFSQQNSYQRSQVVNPSA